MNSRLFLLLLVVALVGESSNSCPAQSEEYAIRSQTNANGRKVGWYVSSATFLKTPEWKFDGKTPPPLDWASAHTKALEWLKKNRKKFDSFILSSYSVQQAGSSEARDRWYYFLNFRGTLDGEEVFTNSLGVMVLMDGTIVEPREEK